MQLISMLAFVGSLFAPGQAAPTPDEDVLGDIVVEAVEPDARGPRLMKLAILPVEGSGVRAKLLGAVVRRDLDLSGQFALAEAVDLEAAHGAEAIVRVGVSRAGTELAVRGEVFFDPDADAPAFTTSVRTTTTGLRASTHRLVDQLMAALTGYAGPFASRLTFVVQRRGTRSAYVVDADGYGLKRVTGDHELVSSVAIGPDGVLYYAASRSDGRYKLYREGDDAPIALDPPGSIYGIGFSPDREQVAFAIAVGRDIRLYRGTSDFESLARHGDLSLVMSPTLAANGAVAVAGTNAMKPRVWVDETAASPKGTTATSPDFCEHPDGTRLVYALGGRGRSHLVAANARGRGARRITRGKGRNSHPACAPDGRLVAFFSTRRRGEGPGLYLARIDGYHLRKIADVRGDSLQWARTP